MPSAPVLARLSEVRRLTAEVAAKDDIETQLAALAEAALELTGFGCGQVYTLEDDLWVGHGGAQCPDFAGCTVCNTDPRFTAFTDGAVVLDRSSEPGHELLADTPPELAKVLVVPVTVGPDRRTVLVLRSDDPSATVDELTMELVHVVADQSAVALEHARAASAERDRVAQVVAAANRHAEFVQVLSHDLRSPLTTIAGIAELLQAHHEQLDESRTTELLDAVSNQSHRLIRMVEDVALAVGGDHEELSIDLTAVAAVDLLREEATRIEADPRSCPVSLDVDTNVVLLVDADRVLQILQNLVDNGCKYGEPGRPVTIRCQLTGDGQRAVIDVINHGPALPEATRASMFTKFARGDEVATGIRGAGLGLYIARRLARAMGGDIALLDGDDTTTMRLTLPVTEDVRLSHRSSRTPGSRPNDRTDGLPG